MDDLISVVIPVYNSEKYLKRCLDSVLKNSYRNLEILLVDDGSTDSSGLICDEYSIKDKRINVIHKTNAGTAAARNTALDTAKGDLIAFADNDDIMHPRFFEYMYYALKSTEADVAVCELTRNMDIKAFMMDIESCPQTVNKHDFIKQTYCRMEGWTRNAPPWNKLYKKHLFNVVRFPEGKGYEDAYTTYKLLYNADKICYLDCILYYWYENPDSYSSKKVNPEKLFFREEAIRLQSDFYSNPEYKDVSEAAKVFYLNQMHIMLWQLENSYLQNKNVEYVRNTFLKLTKKAYKKYKYLLGKSEQEILVEYLFPRRHYILSIFKRLYNPIRESFPKKIIQGKNEGDNEQN